MLDRIGSPRTPSLGDRVRARGLAITGMTVTGPRRASVSGEYPGGLRAAAIARRHLDLLLVEAAVEAGAAFDEGVAALAPVFSGDGRVAGVRVRTERGERAVDATVVIASDGRASRLASA